MPYCHLWPGHSTLFLHIISYKRGTAVAQSLRYYATNRKVAGSIPAGVNGFFIHIKSLRSHYGPGVDSASNSNEHQEHFLGVKARRCVRLTTYHRPVPLSRNLGTLTSWNPLGHSGSVTGLIYLLSHINGRIFEKKVTEHKKCVLVLSATFV